MKIAISGKGGVGKTTIASHLINLFAGNQSEVYAVDGDPDSNLASILGLNLDEDFLPLVKLKDVMATKMGGDGAYFNLNPDVDDILENYSLTKDNIHFLQMGSLKKGGSGCYCKEHSFLRAIINSLFNNNEVVILDMGAGIEHLSRGTADGIDILIIVVEPSSLSIETSLNIKTMAQDLSISRVKIVGNKIYNERASAVITNNFSSSELLGLIPFSEQLLSNSMSRESFKSTDIIDKNINRIYQNLIKEVGD